MAVGAGKEGTRVCLAAQRLRAGHSQESLAHALRADTSTVVRWEAGLSTPQPRRRRRLAEEIHVSLDDLNDLIACRWPCRGRHRRSTGADEAGGAIQRMNVVDLPLGDDTRWLLDPAAPALPPPPDHAGWTEIEVVRAVTRALAGIENRAGGIAVVRSGVGQLRWAVQLLGASSAEVRPALHEAVGNLAEVVGYCAFDDANVALAQRCFDLALRCAIEGQSWPLRAAVLADLARIHAQIGEADAALSAIELAQVRSDRVSATGRAMLHVMRARYSVLTGHDHEALRHVDRADEELRDRDPAIDPPWLAYYDEAEHHGSVGRALLPLAVATGRGELAVPRLKDAVRLQSAAYPRSRLFSRLRLARLLLRLGDPDGAAAAGNVALTEAGEVRSHRVTGEIEELLRASERGHPEAHVMVELRERIVQSLEDRRKLDQEGDSQ